MSDDKRKSEQPMLAEDERIFIDRREHVRRRMKNKKHNKKNKPDDKPTVVSSRKRHRPVAPSSQLPAPAIRVTPPSADTPPTEGKQITPLSSRRAKMVDLQLYAKGKQKKIAQATTVSRTKTTRTPSTRQLRRPQGRSTSGRKLKMRAASTICCNIETDPYFLAAPQCPYGHIEHPKRNCAENPRCLFGLGKEAGLGIWAKRPSVLNALGTDPIRDIRPLKPPWMSKGKTMARETGVSTGSTKYAGVSLEEQPLIDTLAHERCPSGLFNLGATCYMNVVLQSLYMNETCRQAIFEYSKDLQREPGNESGPHGTNNSRSTDRAGKNEDGMLPVAAQSEASSSEAAAAAAAAAAAPLARSTTMPWKELLGHLCELFKSMTHGLRRAAQPRALVELLGLEQGNQQDPMEFHSIFCGNLRKGIHMIDLYLGLN